MFCNNVYEMPRAGLWTCDGEQGSHVMGWTGEQGWGAGLTSVLVAAWMHTCPCEPLMCTCPEPSKLGCMWQNLAFGAVGCLRLALPSSSSVVPSPCSSPAAPEFLTDPAQRLGKESPENVLGLGLVR